MTISAGVDILGNPNIGAQVPCIINGQPYLCSKTYPRNDPHTGKRLFDVSAATEADVHAAIESAQAAFPGGFDYAAYHFSMTERHYSMARDGSGRKAENLPERRKDY